MVTDQSAQGPVANPCFVYRGMSRKEVNVRPASSIHTFPSTMDSQRPTKRSPKTMEPLLRQLGPLPHP